MRRTEDISFDMRKKEDVSFDYGKKPEEKKQEKPERKSFKINIPKKEKEYKPQRAESTVQVKVKKGPWDIVYEWIDSFVFSIILILLVFVFCFRVVGVDGESMMPTLNHGDWLTVKAINTEIKRGDIVIVTQPNDRNEPLVKRVIAVGGQTISIKNGQVTVDGEVLDEPYIAVNSYTRDEGAFGDQYPITVPEGYYFVMGDNRNNSTDSRARRVGLVKKDQIYGKAIVKYSPLNEFDILIGSHKG